MDEFDCDELIAVKRAIMAHVPDDVRIGHYNTIVSAACRIAWLEQENKRLAELQSANEKQGGDMTKMSDVQLRQAFFYGPFIAISGNAIEWAKRRIEYLETHACDLSKLLEQREKNLADLQSNLRERVATIDELDAEIKRLTDQLSGNSTNLESDEELHQRRRRERMLDEVTLICVHLGMYQVTEGVVDQRDWGRAFRDIAKNICNGIDEDDAEQ